MQWTVEGADKATGVEKRIQVEAATRADAERLAGQRGLLISRISASAQRAAVQELERMASGRAAPVAVQPSAPAIDYASPRSPNQRVPSYMGLRIGASVLAVLALLYYIIGIVAVVVTTCGAIYPAPNRNPFAADPLILSIPGYISAVTLLAAGGILHGMAAGCMALRDIARNSFN